MAVSMERPLTPVSISSSNSIAIVEEGDAKPSVWLVFVSKSKDLTTTAVNKAIEEYARVPKDATTNPVIIRLEFIMSEVPTPLGVLKVSQTTKMAAAAYAMEAQKKYLEPMVKLLQLKKVKAEVHITKKDNENDGLILAAKKANAERLYFPIKKSMFNKEITVPQWVVSLPPTCELVCVQGTKVLREMGGSADGLEDVISELGLSDRDDSFRGTPRSSSLDVGLRSTSSGSIEVDPRAGSSPSLDSYSGTFSIDADSGTFVLEDMPNKTVSGPLPLAKSNSSRPAGK